MKFLVYRNGSNAANQPCTFEDVPIAIVESESAAAAAETTWGDEEPNVHGCPTLAAEVIASCGNVDVWANQHVHAVAEAEADPDDWNHVLEASVCESEFDDEAQIAADVEERAERFSRGD